jgi:hypothetical protein
VEQRQRPLDGVAIDDATRRAGLGDLAQKPLSKASTWAAMPRRQPLLHVVGDVSVGNQQADGVVQRRLSGRHVLRQRIGGGSSRFEWEIDHGCAGPSLPQTFLARVFLAMTWAKRLVLGVALLGARAGLQETRRSRRPGQAMTSARNLSRLQITPLARSHRRKPSRRRRGRCGRTSGRQIFRARQVRDEIVALAPISSLCRR